MDSAVKELKRRASVADRNARIRDMENRVDIGTLSKELNKVEGHGYKIIQLPDKNKAQFTQVITPNIRYLVKREYLSTAEMAFLLSISGHVEMHSNAIVSCSDGDQGQYLKIIDIAGLFGYSERQASRLVNSLIEKGIVYEYVDTLTIKKYGRVIKERPLFLNPEIIFCGDRNKVNATLCRLVINADHMEAIRKNPVRLPWKLWIDKGHEFGRLYRRETWLRKKKEARGRKVNPR